jgi:uncharacterized membrane protein YhaH (DUF805 family)
MDRLGTLAAVFFFVFVAYQIWDTHFVMAIVCVICAVAVPFITVSARRAHDRLFGSRPHTDK